METTVRRPLIPLALLTALLCAGCAAEPEPETARPAEKPATIDTLETDHGAAVRAAVTKTKTSSARIAEEIEVGDGTSSFVISVDGDFDWADDRGRLAVRLRDEATPDKTSPRMDEVFRDGDVYVAGLAQLDDGAWGTMPEEELEAHYALRAPGNDPRHVLAQVARMHDVSKAGEERVNGTAAVHYKGTLDQEAVTLRMAEDMREKVDSIRELTGEVAVDADVWIDEQGRIVRTRLDWPLGGASVRATMDLAKYGLAVEAAVPDEADIVPLATLGGPLPG
ncbi:LppX_LprAFG lipoprotein [Streptomyces sp. NPDC001665]